MGDDDVVQHLADALVDEDAETFVAILDECTSLPENVNRGLWSNFNSIHSTAATYVRFLLEAKFEEDPVAAYAKQKKAAEAFCSEFRELQRWCLPIVYKILQDLKRFALSADEQLVEQGQRKEKLEDSARVINMFFTACAMDRSSPATQSRQWGIYRIINLLFWVYFRLDSHNLCKGVFRAVAAAHLPDFEKYPMSHRVEYRYHTGILHFLNDEYEQAERDFEYALQHCHKNAMRRKGAILHYLLPIRLLRGRIAKQSLLDRHPGFNGLYGGLQKAFKQGNLAEFDRLMEAREKALVKRGTYLAFERVRQAALRNLFKCAFVIGGKKAKSPMALYEQCALIGTSYEEEDEVECILANLIYQGYIKGYLSHEKRFVVLSQVNPFPRLGTVDLRNSV